MKGKRRAQKRPRIQRPRTRVGISLARASASRHTNRWLQDPFFFANVIEAGCNSSTVYRGEFPCAHIGGTRADIQGVFRYFAQTTHRRLNDFGVEIENPRRTEMGLDSIFAIHHRNFVSELLIPRRARFNASTLLARRLASATSMICFWNNSVRC